MAHSWDVIDDLVAMILENSGIFVLPLNDAYRGLQDVSRSDRYLVREESIVELVIENGR